jgi:DNA repair protein RecN (Recombination protein N)
MLQSIHIKNIVLIENLELDFKPGFTSLTGETGAGKSIILTSLGLLLGKKADASILRFGSESGEVTGEFMPGKMVRAILAENEIDGDELVIRRKITADGKSKAFINDTPVSLKLLEQIGGNLVEIHGQHDQSSLLEPLEQREIIDKFAKLEKELARLSDAYIEWKSAEKELSDKKANIAKAREEEEYLRHMAGELAALNALPGEDEQLSDQRRGMMEYEKITAVLKDAVEVLSKGKNVNTVIINAQKILVRGNNEKFTNAIDCLERASIEVSEAFSEIERVENDLDMNPDKLNAIEERLFKIREVGRKYERHPDQLAELKAEVDEKLKNLNDDEVDLRALELRVSELDDAYARSALAISEKRKAAAKKIEQKLLAELKPLAMGGTKFQVNFQVQAPSAKGIDKVEFLASTNPGTPLAKLADIASGGEISRFMLAFKVVLLGASSAPTIIFDEIDTGTGGSTAASIGERLAKLGKELQVFVVTHLPQVAALAEHHWKVSKAASGKRNVTNVIELNPKTRKEELARMLAGAEITDEARAAASKLMA